jgi:hypothetical protein
MVSGKLGQTPYKKNQNVTMVLEFCMQINCCCNEKNADLRNLLKYPWASLFFMWLKIGLVEKNRIIG